MPIVNVEETRRTLTIRLDEKKASIVTKYFLKVFVFVLFIIPFLILYFVGFEKEFILGIVIYYAIAIYFLRIYLWNIYGEEVIKVNKKKITQSFDYGWLIEEVVTLENNNIKIQLRLNQAADDFKDLEKVLDANVIKVASSTANVILYKNDEEYFVIKTKTSKEETNLLVEKLSRKLIKRNTK